VITRFDHAVIAVRDLAAALGQFRRLGFDGQPGGRHTGRGTENAIVRFGLDYIELISVYDESEARQSGWGGAALVEFLAEREGGLVGFCLATDNIERATETLRATLPGTQGPIDMQRRRPDGEVLRWRLVIPGRSPWLSPYPFLIEWAMPDSERLSVETPGTHENSASAVAALTVSAPLDELESVRRTYREVFGLVQKASGLFEIDGSTLCVAGGEATAPTHIEIAVKDLGAAERMLVSREIGVSRDDTSLWIDPAAGCGATIALVA
jgi:Glyoxalase-like domain